MLMHVQMILGLNYLNYEKQSKNYIIIYFWNKENNKFNNYNF